jgi:hypothetical protein
MATVSQGIKINTGFTNAASGTTNTTYALYTAPANGYAIIAIQAIANASFVSDARAYVFLTNGSVSLGLLTVYAATGSASNSLYQVYVGPGQILKLTNTFLIPGTGATASATFSGVEFINIS